MNSVRQERGFTLIELLVVIAIIGILSATVLVSLNSARTKARDAKRVADIQTIRTALELYYFDNGRYPSEYACDSSRGSGSGACSTMTGTDWEKTSPLWTGLVPKYIPVIPADPMNNGSYYYVYEPSDALKDFCLGAALEKGGRYHIDNVATNFSC